MLHAARTSLVWHVVWQLDFCSWFLVDCGFINTDNDASQRTARSGFVRGYIGGKNILIGVLACGPPKDPPIGGGYTPSNYTSRDGGRQREGLLGGAIIGEIGCRTANLAENKFTGNTANCLFRRHVTNVHYSL